MQMITDKEVSQAISRNVARLRGARSKYWLAKQAQTTTIHVSRIERGLRVPGPGMLSRLAQALGVTVDTLLEAPKKKVQKGS